MRIPRWSSGRDTQQPHSPQIPVFTQRGVPMAISQELVHLAGATLGEHRRICAFFHSADEDYRVLLPFIKEGLRRGEKAYHPIIDAMRSHPPVIPGAVLLVNPFFVPTDKFLCELEERRAAPSTRPAHSG
jgi:hypothetical protein